MIVASIYAAFIISGCLYVHRWLRYRDIDTWPSVDAKIVGSGGSLVFFQSPGRYGGSSSTAMDSRYTEFEYSVDGQTYRSRTATPDGETVPIYVSGRPHKAHYKPSSPEVAVLIPIPYMGLGILATALFSGMFVAVHLWFTVPEILRKPTEQDGDSTAGEAKG